MADMVYGFAAQAATVYLAFSFYPDEGSFLAAARTAYLTQRDQVAAAVVALGHRETGHA